MDDKKLNNENIEYVEEHYLQISESRIKNTIKEYKSGLPYRTIISTSFACLLSFFTAFASYSNSDSIWKWVFFSLSLVSTVVLIVFGIISLAKKKNGKGTEKWFLEELKGKHYDVLSEGIFDSDRVKKTIFTVINIVLIVGIPISVLLIVLGVNDWNISNKDWSAFFWVFWSTGTLCSLIFGTYINATLAYAIFGYEDGFPNIDIF